MSLSLIGGSTIYEWHSMSVNEFLQYACLMLKKSITKIVNSPLIAAVLFQVFANQGLLLYCRLVYFVFQS